MSSIRVCIGSWPKESDAGKYRRLLAETARRDVARPGCVSLREVYHEEQGMSHIGLALVLLSCLATVGTAQDPADFRPASTNVWDAPYPRVDSKGRVEVRLKARHRA